MVLQWQASSIAGHPMAQTYCFPILPDQELTYFLRELDMPLTVAQIAKPTYEIVKPVFEHAIISLVGTTRYAWPELLPRQPRPTVN